MKDDDKTMERAGMSPEMIKMMIGASRKDAEVCRLHLLRYQDGKSSYLFKRFISYSPVDFSYNSLDTYKQHNQARIYQHHPSMPDGKSKQRNMMTMDDWIVHDDIIRDISGYKCIRATNEKHHVAWFTMDIPIAEGPSIYSGLPGLIVEYDTGKHMITAMSISLPDCDQFEAISVTASDKVLTSEEMINLRKGGR